MNKYLSKEMVLQYHTPREESGQLDFNKTQVKAMAFDNSITEVEEIESRLQMFAETD